MLIPRRRMIWFLMILVALLALPLVVVALMVDDWSRDLTTNVAQTSVDAADTRLRPTQTSSTFDGIARAARTIGQANTSWEYVDAQPSQTGGIIRMVHVSRLLSFRDDVTLTIEGTPDGSATIHMRSASRIGKGDFGQNPRNIHELRRLLEQQIRE